MTSTEWEQGSVLDVSADGAAAEAVSRHVPQLVQQGVASALSRQDSSLWGEAARSEASIRLAWVGLHDTSRELVPRIEALRAELAGEGVDKFEKSWTELAQTVSDELDRAAARAEGARAEGDR